MPGGNDDVSIDKRAGDRQAGVALGREGDETRQSRGRVEQPLHAVQRSRANRIERMRAAEPIHLIEKRAFDVHAGNQAFREGVGRAQRRQRGKAAAHARQIIGDDRRQARGDAIRLEGRARAVQVFRSQAVGVEVDSAVPVHLHVDEASGWERHQCAASVTLSAFAGLCPHE